MIHHVASKGSNSKRAISKRPSETGEVFKLSQDVSELVPNLSLNSAPHQDILVLGSDDG